MAKRKHHTLNPKFYPDVDAGLKLVGVWGLAQASAKKAGMVERGVDGVVLRRRGLSAKYEVWVPRDKNPRSGFHLSYRAFVQSPEAARILQEHGQEAVVQAMHAEFGKKVVAAKFLRELKSWMRAHPEEMENPARAPKGPWVAKKLQYTSWWRIANLETGEVAGLSIGEQTRLGSDRPHDRGNVYTRKDVAERVASRYNREGFKTYREVLDDVSKGWGEQNPASVHGGPYPDLSDELVEPAEADKLMKATRLALRELGREGEYQSWTENGEQFRQIRTPEGHTPLSMKRYIGDGRRNRSWEILSDSRNTYLTRDFDERENPHPVHSSLLESTHGIAGLVAPGAVAGEMALRYADRVVNPDQDLTGYQMVFQGTLQQVSTARRDLGKTRPGVMNYTQVTGADDGSGDYQLWVKTDRVVNPLTAGVDMIDFWREGRKEGQRMHGSTGVKPGVLDRGEVVKAFKIWARYEGPWMIGEEATAADRLQAQKAWVNGYLGLDLHGKRFTDGSGMRLYNPRREWVPGELESAQGRVAQQGAMDALYRRATTFGGDAGERLLSTAVKRGVLNGTQEAEEALNIAEAIYSLDSGRGRRTVHLAEAIQYKTPEALEQIARGYEWDGESWEPGVDRTHGRYRSQYGPDSAMAKRARAILGAMGRSRNPITGQNVRIARKIRTPQGAVIRTEVLGSWFVDPADMNGSRMAYVRKQLAEAQEEEPAAGWMLETKGTGTLWHPWGSQQNPAMPGTLPNVRLIADKELANLHKIQTQNGNWPVFYPIARFSQAEDKSEELQRKTNLQYGQWFGKRGYGVAPLFLMDKLKAEGGY